MRRHEPWDAFDNQDNAQNNNQGFREHKPFHMQISHGVHFALTL
jgi:hypothetical protein